MKPIHVLIVEDSQDDATLLLDALRRGGFDPEAIRVETPDAMSRALAEQSWDAIIADYVVPGFDGLEALRLAKGMAPLVPFIIVSSKITDETAVESVKAGAHDYVMKDRLSRLPAAIERELHVAEDRRQRVEAARDLSEMMRPESGNHLSLVRQNADERAQFLANVCYLSSQALVAGALDGGVATCNPAFTELSGYTEEEATAMAGPWELAPPKLREQERRILNEVRQTGEPQRYDSEWLRKDGSKAPVEVLAQRLCDSERVPRFYALFATDITARRQTEQALSAMNKELENIVTVRTQQLERSNAELQQFAYVASHDLLEPLRTVGSYVQLLARRYQRKLDSDADDFINFAVDGVTRMQRLLDDLLRYSRVGTRSKEFAPTDCEAVLEGVLAGLKTAIEESGAVVTHDPLPTLMADDSQLQQLFQNLISNALKFRGVEAPRVHVSASRVLRQAQDDLRQAQDDLRQAQDDLRQAQDDLRQAQDDGAGKAHGENSEWVFSVSDNGIGIAPENRERVFEVFGRLHAQGEYPGSGLGLAICKKIVERHGGRIWVESEPGNESTFYFTVQG